MLLIQYERHNLQLRVLNSVLVYSYNKKLEVIKFNLLSKNWKINIIALGGIKSGNIKKISLTKTVGFGGISFFEDKNPAHNLMRAGFYKKLVFN